MKQDSIKKHVHPFWHLDPGDFCSWPFTICWVDQWTKESCFKTSRWKIVSSGKPENCLNECHMRRGNGAKNRLKFPKPQRCHLWVTRGLKHIWYQLSSIQLPKRSPCSGCRRNAYFFLLSQPLRAPKMKRVVTRVAEMAVGLWLVQWGTHSLASWGLSCRANSSHYTNLMLMIWILTMRLHLCPVNEGKQSHTLPWFFWSSP